jgi:hypothetical protein
MLPILHVCTYMYGPFRIGHFFLILSRSAIGFTMRMYVCTYICMYSITLYVKRETNKVDRAKRMHCVRSERVIAITLVVRRL